MKSRINLYTESFRPAPFRFGRWAMGSSLAALILLLLVIGAWKHWQNLQMQAQYEALHVRRTALESHVLALSKRLDTRVESQSLLQEIAEESNALNGKRHLIVLLADNQLIADQGFSNLMQGLSGSHMEGLWLTRIHAEGENLDLVGRSLSEELLPQWIRQLSSQQHFRGKQFGRLDLLRPQETASGQLEFHLSTRLAEESGNG